MLPRKQRSRGGNERCYVRVFAMRSKLESSQSILQTLDVLRKNICVAVLLYAVRLVYAVYTLIVTTRFRFTGQQ